MSESEFTPSKTHAETVENETKFSVPAKLVAPLWEYLQAHYLSTQFLNQLGSALSATLGEDQFMDVYFDDPALTLTQRHCGIRHRSQLINGEVSKSIVHIKLQKEGFPSSQRTELKFPVQKVGAPTSDSLLSLIVSDRQQDFINKLQALGIDAVTLKPVLTLHQHRHRIYVTQNNKPMMTITLDHVHATQQEKTADWTELELELDEEAFTLGNATIKAQLIELREIIQKDVLQQFPEVRPDQMPKANKVLQAFNQLF